MKYSELLAKMAQKAPCAPADMQKQDPSAADYMAKVESRATAAYGLWERMKANTAPAPISYVMWALAKLRVESLAHAKAYGRLEMLEKRCKDLELREKAMRYRGVWQPADSYEKGNLATFDGSLWIAIAESPGKPGISGWQLAAKRGADSAR